MREGPAGGAPVDGLPLPCSRGCSSAWPGRSHRDSCTAKTLHLRTPRSSCGGGELRRTRVAASNLWRDCAPCRQDRAVAVDLAFRSCPASCPPGAARVSRLLGSCCVVCVVQLVCLPSGVCRVCRVYAVCGGRTCADLWEYNDAVREGVLAIEDVAQVLKRVRKPVVRVEGQRKRRRRRRGGARRS